MVCAFPFTLTARKAHLMSHFKTQTGTSLRLCTWKWPGRVAGWVMLFGCYYSVGNYSKSSKRVSLQNRNLATISASSIVDLSLSLLKRSRYDDNLANSSKGYFLCGDTTEDRTEHVLFTLPLPSSQKCHLVEIGLFAFHHRRFFNLHSFCVAFITQTTFFSFRLFSENQLKHFVCQHV